jgi:hypothetical protein
MSIVDLLDLHEAIAYEEDCIAYQSIESQKGKK